MADNPFSIRPDAELRAWLEGRARRAVTGDSLSRRSRIELTLWREVMACELARQRWTLGELGLIADVMNGAIVQDEVPNTIGQVATAMVEVTTYDPSTWAERWGVDVDGLVARLTRLGPAADIALADAVARWWEGEYEHSAEGWASVGVMVRA